MGKGRLNQNYSVEGRVGNFYKQYVYPLMMMVLFLFILQILTLMPRYENEDLM